MAAHPSLQGDESAKVNIRSRPARQQVDGAGMSLASNLHGVRVSKNSQDNGRTQQYSSLRGKLLRLSLPSRAALPVYGTSHLLPSSWDHAETWTLPLLSETPSHNPVKGASKARGTARRYSWTGQWSYQLDGR